MSHNTSTAWAVYENASDGYESISVYKNEAELREALADDLYDVMGGNAEQFVLGTINSLVSALNEFGDGYYYIYPVSL